MSKLVLIASLCLLGSFAKADMVYDTAAASICSGFFTDSSKTSCLEKIKFKKFDKSVIDICANQFTDTSKLECLNIIADKQFVSPIELSNCRSQFTDSSKMACLQKATTIPFQNPPPAPTVSLRQIDSELGRAINLLRSGRYNQAEGALEDLRALIRENIR